MAWLEALCVTGIILWIIYKWVEKKHRYWADRNVAFEKPLPFIGNTLDSILMKKALGELICDVYRKHKGEKVVGMWIFGKPALVIRDPEIAHSIFTTNFSYFANNDLDVDEKNDPIMARNMFVQKDEQWKRTRQLVTPGFTQGKIKSGYSKFEDVAKKLVDYVKRNPQELELKHTMSLFTSEIVAHWGIGIDGHSFTDEDPVLIKLGKLIFEPSVGRQFIFMGLFFFPRLVKILKLSMVPKEVHDFFDSMLRKLIKDREASPGKSHDYLQYFIDVMKKRQILRHEDQNELTEDDVIGAGVTFFVEGYETSSMIVSFILWHLIRNPEIQEKLQEEVDEIFESTNEKPSLEAILELPYLQRIYLEIVRLHTGFNSAKRCTKPFSMDIGKGKPLLIEPGTSILIPLIGLQTDPEYWENPLKFDPDRHLDESLIKRKGIYMPFGEGPRMCIGMRIAQATIKTAVAHLVRNFNIVETANTPKTYIQDPKAFLPRHKNGCYGKFVPRQRS